MTLKLAVELFAAYCAAAGLLAVLVLAVAISRFGSVPLLDGTHLGSALDDSDRRRMLLAHDEADRAPDLFALALEEIRNLAEVEHP